MPPVSPENSDPDRDRRVDADDPRAESLDPREHARSAQRDEPTGGIADTRPLRRADAERASAALMSPLLRRPSVSPGRLLLAVGSLVLLVLLLAFALPWATGAGWGEILTALGAAPLWAIPVMVLLGLAALALEAATVSVAAPGAGYARSLQAHAVSSGLGLAIPGGGLLGTGAMGWLLHRAGLTVVTVVAAIVLASGVETVVSALLMPIVGLGAYALASLGGAPGLDLPGGVWTAVGAVALSLLALGSLAAMLNRRLLVSLLDSAAAMGLADAEDEDISVVRRTVLDIRDAVVEQLRRKALGLIAPTLLARIVQFAALLLALQAVGAEVPLLLALAVFALARTLSLVPVTPGGAGVTETVGAAALVALAVPAPEAATAMLLLALTTLVAPLLASAAAFAATPRRAQAEDAAESLGS